jgi:hypothetical protein
VPFDGGASPGPLSEAGTQPQEDALIALDVGASGTDSAAGADLGSASDGATAGDLGWGIDAGKAGDTQAVPDVPTIDDAADAPATSVVVGLDAKPDGLTTTTIGGDADSDAADAGSDAPHDQGLDTSTAALDGAGRLDSYLSSPDARDARDTGKPLPDTTPPDTVWLSTPSTVTNNPSPTFTFNSTEPGTFECRLDSGPAALCSSPYTAGPLSDGRHVLDVTAIDLAGNRDPSPATFGFTVDVIAPDTQLRGWPLPTTGKYAAFAFTSSEAKSSFECSLDDSDVWASCTSPMQYVLTADGAHSFRVRAVDQAGNRDATPASASFEESLAQPTPFPDSSTIFCTDGNAKVDCPVQGAAGWGQDGTYLINRPQYTSAGGTVTDAITGLTWEQGNAPADTWDAQVARCSSLSTYGYTDWRLPTRLEIITIIDAGRTQPTFDTSVFSSTPMPSYYYWLGQELDGVPTAAWLADWTSSRLTWNGKNAKDSAKCVRGTALSGTLTASDSGLTVYDSRTNLTWQRTVDGTKYAWLDAISYCNSLSLESMAGWRLPTVKELQTLIDVGNGKNPPTISPLFPTGHEVDMWTASPSPATPSSSYTVNMFNGSSVSQPTSNLLQIRCVR